MKYSKLISKQNLLLAWRRINTGRNFQYKRFFRPLFLAYEMGHQKSIKQLHDRLKGHWEPTTPTRIYVPKPSGLQRPLTLLSLEDQIVLQAIANIFAEKLIGRRKKVEGKVVFSNCLNTDSDPIFFFQNWQTTYNLFQSKIEDYYNKNYKWSAHFDLAAFYDTISHELLIKSIAPRNGYTETRNRISNWLREWRATKESSPYPHGIPQGPIASDFLAESFLLKLDESMLKENVPYVRYVDDIRIFAKTKLDALKYAVKLEILCNNLGLIPQGKKFAIKRVESLKDALGCLPSLAPPDRENIEETPPMEAEEAEFLFYESIGSKPYEIIDKSRARYVLFRAPKSKKLLQWVLILLPRHPEHIDAFSKFLSNYRKSKPIEKTLTNLLKDDLPYEYIKGEFYHLLSILGTEYSFNELLPFAKKEITKRDSTVCLKLGVMEFFLACQKNGLGNYISKIKYQHSLVKSLLVPLIPDEEYEKKKGIVKELLAMEIFDPGIMLLEQLAKRNKTHRFYNLLIKDLCPQVQNVFRGGGLIWRRYSPRVDQIGEILDHRFGISISTFWRNLLKDKYTHALRILIIAESSFDLSPSHWLQNQNSFNDLVTRELLESLKNKGLPGYIKTIGRDGRLVKFGQLLDSSKPFSQNYPNVASPFRNANERRNNLPSSHALDEKSGSKCLYLTRYEQKKFLSELKKSYSELQELMPILL